MRRAEPDEETIFCFEFFNWYIYTYLKLRWGGVYDEERQTKVTYWRSIHDMAFFLKSNLAFPAMATMFSSKESVYDSISREGKQVVEN